MLYMLIRSCVAADDWSKSLMDFTTAVSNVGVAVACLGALGLALWQSAKWGSQNILKPMADRHIKFLDDLTTGMAAQSQALQTLTAQQNLHLDRMEEMMRKQDELIRAVCGIECRGSPSNPPKVG